MDRPGGMVLVLRKRGRCRAGHSTSVRYLGLRMLTYDDVLQVRDEALRLECGDDRRGILCGTSRSGDRFSFVGERRRGERN